MASFSTDFDGVGTGDSISVNFMRGYNYGAAYSAYAFAARAAQASAARIAEQQEMQRRYDEQLAAAKARVLAEEQRREAEERAREIEEAREREAARVQAVKNVISDYDALQTLEGAKPQTVLTQALDIAHVIDLAKGFDQLERVRVAAQLTLLEQLAALLGKTKPRQKKQFVSVLVWGLWCTSAQAADATKKPTIDPFTGRPFDQVFAFGSSPFSITESDLQRVVLDHFASTVGVMSIASSIGASGLMDASVDELVCHSNGFRVVEVLIQTGHLKVNKLRILGGDGVLGEISNLETLAATQKISEVSAYVIDGDLVPHSDVLWEIRQQTAPIGHGLQSFDSEKQNPAYQFMGLVDRPAYDPRSAVQVHVLSPPPDVFTPVGRHLYSTYENLIYMWRGSGCMTQGGQMNPSCIIH